MPKAGRKGAVTISPRDFRRRMVRLLRSDYPKLYDRFVNEISEEAVRIMKTLVPVRSGRLRDSVMIRKKSKKGGGADRRANIEIGPTVFYGRYVDQGTQPSSGRYVPELGRRLTSGMHPGIKGRFFTDATAREIGPKINDFYSRFSMRPFKKRWGRKIKPKGR